MKKKTEAPKKQELLLEQVDKLRALKLPLAWKVAKLDVTFRREGFLEDYAEVIYDDRNGTFYVKTNKSICYPEEVRALKEGIAIMSKANEIIGSKRKTKS